MDTDNIQSITIIGKRWFNKTYGNTYFSSLALVNGETEIDIPFEYGYGNQYEWEAWRLLVNQLNLDVERYKGNLIEAPSTYCRRKGIAYHSIVTDVQRKKDL